MLGRKDWRGTPPSGGLDFVPFFNFLIWLTGVRIVIVVDDQQSIVAM